MTQRRRTATSNFGVGRREAHDAQPFYDRFAAPEISSDDDVALPREVADPFICGDARHMKEVADNSVALIVTSPPYFAGKQYEEELDREGVPSSYLEYLDLLRAVFAECKRTLEPGGRIAVNVANLGRKPYRSLASDVLTILQDDLRMLPRGEVVWQKGEGASGSCAWGSFRSAANPVLRDITERVIIASKGRFDRAKNPKLRRELGLPYRNSIKSDDFMSYTLDLWQVPPESARRVQHPAPFPVELPERLIELYTYEDDLVLDPFMGSGSTLIAASRSGRRHVGYDLDPEYVALARSRMAEELASETPAAIEHKGQAAPTLVREHLEAAGFKEIKENHRVRGLGITLTAATDAKGHRWYFDLAGAFTTHRGGMLRNDAVWKVLGRAHVLANNDVGPVVIVTPHLPRPGSEGAKALRAAGPRAFFDAIELLDTDSVERLARYGRGVNVTRPLPGYWSEKELARLP